MTVKCSLFVRICQVPDVPTQKKIHLIHASGCQMQRIPSQPFRHQVFINIAPSDRDDFFVNHQSWERLHQQEGINLSGPIPFGQLRNHAIGNKRGV